MTNQQAQTLSDRLMEWARPKAPETDDERGIETVRWLNRLAWDRQYTKAKAEEITQEIEAVISALLPEEEKEAFYQRLPAPLVYRSAYEVVEAKKRKEPGRNYDYAIDPQYVGMPGNANVGFCFRSEDERRELVGRLDAAVDVLSRFGSAHTMDNFQRPIENGRAVQQYLRACKNVVRNIDEVIHVLPESARDTLFLWREAFSKATGTPAVSR